jgi:type VI secretion system protein ImpL
LSAGTIAQFQNAAKIRDAFFTAGGQALKVQFELKPVSLDSAAASFVLNIEGQEISNQHGPDAGGSFQWPGPAPNKGIRMVFKTPDGKEVASPLKQGPWALFRFLSEAALTPTGDPVRYSVTFQVGEFHARYELLAASVQNPFNLAALRAFQCPGGL